jgi:hypothetical protein
MTIKSTLLFLLLVVSLSSCYSYHGFYERKAVLQANNRFRYIEPKKKSDVKPGDTIIVISKNTRN